MTTTTTETGWTFNKDYDDFAQVEHMLPAFRARLAELEAAGQYRYNDSFRGHLGVEFASQKDEDSAIYMCQNLDRNLLHAEKVDGMLADGWTVTTAPGRYEQVAIVNDSGCGVNIYPSARIVANGSRLVVLPKGKRTNGYATEGRRLLVPATPAAVAAAHKAQVDRLARTYPWLDTSGDVAPLIEWFEGEHKGADRTRTGYEWIGRLCRNEAPRKRIHDTDGPVIVHPELLLHVPVTQAVYDRANVTELDAHLRPVEDLPEVHRLSGHEDAPIHGFEVTAVRITDDAAEATDPQQADVWSVYVTFDGAPTMHVTDRATTEEAETVAAKLAERHGVTWTHIDGALDTSWPASRQCWIDTGRYLTREETAEDRARDLQAKDGMIGMSDQPTTCGKCGRRTEWIDLADSDEGETRQLHECACGHEFVVESDRELAEHDENHDEDDFHPGCTYCEANLPAAPQDDRLAQLLAAVDNDYEGDVLRSLIERAGLTAPVG